MVCRLRICSTADAVVDNDPGKHDTTIRPATSGEVTDRHRTSGDRTTSDRTSGDVSPGDRTTSDRTTSDVPPGDATGWRRISLLSGATVHELGTTPMTVVTGALDPGLSPPALIDGRSGSRRPYLPTFVLAASTMWLLWVGANTIERTGSLGPVLAAGRAELIAPAVLALVAVTLACERRWPAERREVLARGHLHDAAFFAVHVIAVVPFMTVLGIAFTQLLGSHRQWIEAPWTSSWPRWPLLVVTLVLMDGANWLAHWADHRFAPLWRVHALHHTQEELSVLTSFRAHPLSHVPGFLLATIPVIALMGNRGMAPALITGYVCLGTLPHANLSWTFGPLGKVVVSPAYHRLHHSIDGPEGFNLGIVLTVWDVAASRARFPAKNTPACRTGLAGRPLRTEQDQGGRWRPGLLLTQLAEPFGTEAPSTTVAGRFNGSSELTREAVLGTPQDDWHRGHLR